MTTFDLDVFIRRFAYLAHATIDLECILQSDIQKLIDAEGFQITCDDLIFNFYPSGHKMTIKILWKEKLFCVYHEGEISTYIENKSSREAIASLYTETDWLITTLLAAGK